MDIIQKLEEKISIVLVLQTDKWSYTCKWATQLEKSKSSPVEVLENVRGQKSYSNEPSQLFKIKCI